jgi:thiol-disulfide isomerase/thioredoxin
VKAAYAREHADGRTLLVYVGATWCEPCQRFHHAVDSGQLDASFPKLTFLAFDADKDGEALANGGYYSRLIPLIAIPNADGKASGRQIEGGIKGDGTVAFITTKLQGLLSGGS